MKIKGFTRGVQSKKQHRTDRETTGREDVIYEKSRGTLESDI